MDKIVRRRGQRRFQSRDTDPAIGAVQGQQLGAAGEELRRAALVNVDVGVPVVEDPAPRRRQHRQSQGVSGSAGGQRRDDDAFRVAFEQRRQTTMELLGPRVFAIRGGGAAVGGG